MGRKRALIAGKHLIYCFGLIFCYVLQTTPGFLQIFGVKPFLVIPAVIAIAMQEGEFTGALYGALGGMLCDMGANTFYGFYTLTLFLYGAAVGLALIYLTLIYTDHSFCDLMGNHLSFFINIHQTA